MQKNFPQSERGAVMVTFALALTVMLGFTALAYEVGYWYVVRSELSKAVDAAALSAAANISNPYAQEGELGRQFGLENFQPGFLGTPETGPGAVRFIETREPDRVRVEGQVSTHGTLSRLFGMETVSVRSMGVAEILSEEAEIMLVLDRSGSMDPPIDGRKPIDDLKDAAANFVEFFQETQDTDRMGLITFASTVVINPELRTNFVDEMLGHIQSIRAEGFTNIEDALLRAGDENKGGLTMLEETPVQQRTKQYVVFFSDGNPTAFRGTFRNVGMASDGVGFVMCPPDTACCLPDSDYQPAPFLAKTGEDKFIHSEGPVGSPDYHSFFSWNTGDGLPVAQTQCQKRDSPSAPWSPFSSTQWIDFAERPIPMEDPQGSQDTYHPTQCGWYDAQNAPENVDNPYDLDTPSDESYYNSMGRHICTIARDKSLSNAQLLKERGITIFAVGFGDIDTDFLQAISSGPEFVFYAPDSQDIANIFQEIARRIAELRLIQ